MRRAPVPAALLALIALLPLAGCALFRRAKPLPPPNPHYVLGKPYRSGGVWWYPREDFAGVQTGIATTVAAGHAPLTADGERYDPTALAAAMQTIQLPAVARVTDLDNGRQIDLRVNDRGPESPARLIALTPRAAALLAMHGPARVRVEILPRESYWLADHVGGGPKLALTAAPLGAVQATDLPPPGQTRSAQPTRTIGEAGPAGEAGAAAFEEQPVPDRMPERITQTSPAPGSLAVRMSTFASYAPAEIQLAAVAPLGARMERERMGRQEHFTVLIGPIDTIEAADRLLAEAMARGVPDARIIVQEEGS